MNIHYDDRPPGHAKAAGFWVDRAWQDVLDERRLAVRGQQNQKFDFSKPRQVHRHYAPTDRCEVCHVSPPTLSGKCSPCYHREYMRAYAKTHQQKKSVDNQKEQVLA